MTTEQRQITITASVNRGTWFRLRSFAKANDVHISCCVDQALTAFLARSGVTAEDFREGDPRSPYALTDS